MLHARIKYEACLFVCCFFPAIIHVNRMERFSVTNWKLEYFFTDISTSYRNARNTYVALNYAIYVSR